MNISKIENAVIVTNKTRLEQLTARFNTQAQAKFYIEQSQKNFYANKSSGSKVQNQDIMQKKNKISSQKNIQNSDFTIYEEEHKKFHESLSSIRKQLSPVLKIKEIDQSFLSNNIFTDKDLIIVVGQDGLVANTAKYVSNIPIIAINPDESRYDGILLPFNSVNFMLAIQRVLTDNFISKNVTMAEVKLNDGQRLVAFNDLFIGVSTHSSARYQISLNNDSESQSSSGIIVSTGAGSTGWLSSVYNMTNGLLRAFSNYPIIDFKKVSQDYENLFFVVREPFVSKTSLANIVAGEIKNGEILTIESFMPQNGVIFSDGIQSDFLQFNSGTIAEIGVATEKAILVL